MPTSPGRTGQQASPRGSAVAESQPIGMATMRPSKPFNSDFAVLGSGRSNDDRVWDFRDCQVRGDDNRMADIQD